ncbi:hypothetical protein [Spirosoma aerolatum]|nr:hypothetical protein [Spirosoma aerolatum]
MNDSLAGLSRKESHSSVKMAELSGKSVNVTIGGCFIRLFF